MKRDLIPISLNHTMPKEWLDTIVPENLKLLPNCYAKAPFYIKNNAIDKERLTLIKNELHKAEKLGIIASSKLITSAERNTNIRNTYRMTYSDEVSKLLEDIFKSFMYEVGEFFNLTLLDRSKVQVLGYSKGCFYKRHSDNCSEVVDKDGIPILFKPVTQDRKITTILFLSTQEVDFSGGELEFEFIYDSEGKKVKISPQEGLFLAFPSNPYFSHSVKEVTSGFRISLVKWWNAMVF
ncbi:MAG: prolyl hydroxylase family protein [Campylobacterales bacterium]